VLCPDHLNIIMPGLQRQNLNALRDCLIRQCLPWGPWGLLRGCSSTPLEGLVHQGSDGHRGKGQKAGVLGNA